MLMGVRLDAQVVITIPGEGEISPFRNLAVIGTGTPNLPVRLDLNGVPVDSGKVRPNGIFEFLGVPTPEGPVTYRVNLIMPSGRIHSAERHIHVLGSPDSIVLEIPSEEFPADGRTVIPVRASVRDKWSVTIPDGYLSPSTR